jgi:hypothetical protein
MGGGKAVTGSSRREKAESANSKLIGILVFPPRQRREGKKFKLPFGAIFCLTTAPI